MSTIQAQRLYVNAVYAYLRCQSSHATQPLLDRLKATRDASLPRSNGSSRSSPREDLIFYAPSRGMTDQEYTDCNPSASSGPSDVELGASGSLVTFRTSDDDPSSDRDLVEDFIPSSVELYSQGESPIERADPRLNMDVQTVQQTTRDIYRRSIHSSRTSTRSDTGIATPASTLRSPRPSASLQSTSTIRRIHSPNYPTRQSNHRPRRTRRRSNGSITSETEEENQPDAGDSTQARLVTLRSIQRSLISLHERIQLLEDRLDHRRHPKWLGRFMSICSRILMLALPVASLFYAPTSASANVSRTMLMLRRIVRNFSVIAIIMLILSRIRRG